MVFKSIIGSICTCLVVASFNSHAYSLTYDFDVRLGENAHFATSSDSLSLSDSYNAYSEMTWETASAVDDGNGGVTASYTYSQLPWDYYNTGIYGTFEIISDYGNINSEQVTVDVWGGLYLYGEYQNSPVAGMYTCCEKLAFLEADGVELWGSREFVSDEPNNFSSITRFDTLDDSITLFTNTTYDFMYRTEIYAEALGGPGSLQTSFSSWDEYYAYVEEYGDSGIAYSSANGFMNFNMDLSSVEVPEPSTLMLMGIGLLGFRFSRKKT